MKSRPKEKEMNYICISDSEINDQAQTKIAADELFPDFNTNWLKMQDYETEPL